MLFIVAGVAVGLLLADKIVLNPLADLWKERSARIEMLEASVYKGEGLLKRESFLVRRWNSMNEGSLTNNQSEAENGVLSRVDEWSQDSGVKITSYTPQWRTGEEGAGSVDVRLAGTTSLGSLVEFVHLMDQKELPLRIDMLTLTSQDRRGSELGFELRFSGLMLNGGDQ